MVIEGPSNNWRSGVDLIWENEHGLVIEVSLIFKFPITNNQFEYEAVIVDPALASEMGAKNVKLQENSQLTML